MLDDQRKKEAKDRAEEAKQMAKEQNTLNNNSDNNNDNNSHSHGSLNPNDTINHNPSPFINPERLKMMNVTL